MDRCAWCIGDKLLIDYHDREWGVRRLHDERALFEFMTLEMMQCGLSWLTVLRKREAMRAAFDDFDPRMIAGYDDTKLESLMTAPGIIHSAAKLRAMRDNARRFLDIADEYGSFDSWIWSFTGGRTMIYPENRVAMPSKNALSEKVSAALKERGFRFMGPVVVYSYMQAIGMINDHEPGCCMADKLT